MATKIARKTQIQFAGNAVNTGQFGSAAAGTYVISNDPAVIQALPAYGQGWVSATLTSQRLPTLEETQGVDFVQSYQAGYLLQEGIPEYDAGTSYFQHSIVKNPGTYQIYGSIIDNNLGNTLATTADWLLLCDLSDIAAKSYVDSIVAGLSPKASSRVGTTAALTATYANGASGVGATLTNSGTQIALAIDSVTLAVNDRVLVKNQGTALQNGIYVVTNIGSGSTNWILTRSADYNQPSEIFEGTYTILEEGTTQAGSMWIMTSSGTITIGTSSINFTALTIPGTVTLTGTQTLTNKTLTAPIINIPVISGRTDGGTASAGNIGEVIQANVAVGSAVSLVTAIAKTITSISLPAGSWMIFGNVQFATAASTTATLMDASISTVNNTEGTVGTTAVARYNSSNIGTNAGYGMMVGPVLLNLSVTTTVYLVANAQFAVSTCSAYGQIIAMRVQQ